MANASKKISSKKNQQPPQKQSRQPGRQHKMTPQPQVIADDYRAAGKLDGKATLITGGDSGIGASVAVGFAREGADVAIVYLEEQRDAQATRQMVEDAGRKCVLIKGDVSKEAFCKRAVQQTVRKLGRLDVLVNNAAVQYPQKSIADIDEAQLLKTFRTNIFAMFFLARAALPHLQAHDGSSIINTTSVTAYRGIPNLVDYASTKGAIVGFTRSLALQLSQADPPVRVNGVAPGPIWTPLIPASFDAKKVATFGSDTPLGRAGQPSELIGAYVYLASGDSSYVTGQVIHVNGGEIING